MDLKKFSPDATEQEINDFQSTHIIYKFQVIDDGGIYLFYKDPYKIGNEVMEEVEQIDRLAKQAQNEILAGELDITGNEQKLADLKEELSKLETNDKNWDQVDAKIKQIEREILQGKATVVERKIQVEAFRAKVESILKQPK